MAENLAATTLRMTREAAGVMGGLLPDAARTDWLELGNKLHAFEWFSFAGARLASPGAASQAAADAAAARSLAEQAGRAAALADPFTGIWAMEGLGHAWAKSTPLPPRDLLSPARRAGVAAPAVAPRHTGAARAVAERLLAALAPHPGNADDDRAVVRRWLDHCQDGLRPGYAELAAEALGLVARQLQPCLLGRLDELLAEADGALADYLWHGVGRGLYFAPTQLLPWSGGWARAFAKAVSEPPRAAGRGNAVAGLAWALTLVNLRSPAIVEAAITSADGGHAGHAGDGGHAGDDGDDGLDAAIAHGAAGALLVWRHWAGAEAWLARFLDHRPAAADRERRWRRRVVDPCRAALDSTARDLRRDDLAALFRFKVPS